MIDAATIRGFVEATARRNRAEGRRLGVAALVAALEGFVKARAIAHGGRASLPRGARTAAVKQYRALMRGTRALAKENGVRCVS